MTPSLPSRIRAERGSVTYAAVALVTLALILAAGVTAIGQALIARNRVVTAAEAGALAAAPVTFRAFGTTGLPVRQAAAVVHANGARMLRCDCPPDRGYDPRTVSVTAVLTAEILGLRQVTFEATALAEFRPVAVLAGP